jgi:cbb3-type cytochrome oxidase subunit 3
MLANHDAAYIHLVWLIASLVGVTILAVLAVAYRRAAQRAELEHAERVIAEDDQLSSAGASGGDAPNCR